MAQAVPEKVSIPLGHDPPIRYSPPMRLFSFASPFLFETRIQERSEKLPGSCGSCVLQVNYKRVGVTTVKEQGCGKERGLSMTLI